MVTLLARLLGWLRPDEGWPAFLITVIAALCLPAALLESESAAAGPALLLPAFLAVVVAVWLAHSRLTWRSAAVAGTLAGAALAVVIVGRLVPPPHVWWQGPLPAAAYAWQRVEVLGIRLWWWGQNAAVAAGGEQDTVVLELLLALSVWGAGFVTAWQIYRSRAGWHAVVPAGVAVSLVAFFLGGLAVFYLFLYLLCALSLVAICRLWRRRAHWEETGIDHPDSLGVDLTLALAPWLVLVLALAALLPVLRIRSVQDAFWRQMEGPWSEVETVAERLFGPIETGYRGSGRGPAGGELPQAHLLGAGPELSEAIVLYVGTSDPAPPRPEPDQEGIMAGYPRRYWRAATYDVYTGLGWTNSTLEEEVIPPGEALQAPPPGEDLVQQFELVVEGRRIFAANTPIHVDTEIVAWWRAPGDLARLAGEAQRYAAVSRVHAPTVVELRASASLAAPVPAGLAEQYLALPADLPSRVVELARDVVGDAATRYDAARRLEAYLRTYPYNEDLPAPPDDRDLVDYFLFERQEGYCDYYASALAVMARSVGEPARLATGYAQGTYDHDARRWVVTEQEGHSWVEVYFDGIGWVEFEPTAGEAALERAGGEATPGALPPLPLRTLRWWERVPWGLVAVAGVVLGLLALLVWLWRPRAQPLGDDIVRDRYNRLLRWGRRLRHPLRDGQTPSEYAGSLADVVRARAEAARWQRARQAGGEAPEQIEQLADAFAEAQYSPHRSDEHRRWQIRTLWSRLRQHLATLWLGPR